MSSARPPRFHAFRGPESRGAISRKIRSSPRGRGLGHRWDKMSLAHRRLFPFCRLCEQEGRDGLADVVDHILPRAEYPGLAFEETNLQSLCRHHDGVKQAMEDFARKHGLLERLTLWCSALDARPAEFTGGITTRSAFDAKNP